MLWEGVPPVLPSSSSSNIWGSFTKGEGKGNGKKALSVVKETLFVGSREGGGRPAMFFCL